MGKGINGKPFSEWINFESGFLFGIFRKEDRKMRKLQTKVGKLKAGYWTVISAVSALMISVMPVWAADKTVNIWDRFSAIMRDFYGQILAISTIVAVTMAAVALVVRMVSRNQRAVDEATAWLKRIVITWVILNSLGLIVAYLQPLITGGNYTG